MARRKTRLKIPPPGLPGAYAHSCVICLQGCDTGLALHGEAEWIIAGLLNLGIPDMDEAATMLGTLHGCDPGMVPNGLGTVTIQLCHACLEASSLRDTGMVLGLLVAVRRCPAIASVQRPISRVAGVGHGARSPTTQSHMRGAGERFREGVVRHAHQGVSAAWP